MRAATATCCWSPLLLKTRATSAAEELPASASVNKVCWPCGFGDQRPAAGCLPNSGQPALSQQLFLNSASPYLWRRPFVARQAEGAASGQQVGSGCQAGLSSYMVARALLLTVLQCRPASVQASRHSRSQAPPVVVARWRSIVAEAAANDVMRRSRQPLSGQPRPN